MPTRRNLLLAGAAGLLAAASTAGAQPAPDNGPKSAPPRRRQRIGISTYSFWRFRDDSKLSIEECIAQSSAMGFDGVEILHRQMTSEENGYLQNLKRRAIIEGLDLCGLSIHQGFVSPDAAVRKKNV